jgi:excisionase family DNA binding protein
MARKPKVIQPAAIKRLPLAGSAYEFAKIIGVDKMAISRWISRGGMPAVKIKNRYSVIRDEFLAWARKTNRVKD